MYTVELSKPAEREFGKLPKEIRHRFATAIEKIQIDPRRMRSGVDIKRLHGPRTAYRLRIGDYRGIYEIEGNKVVFTRFGHRSRIYAV